MSASNRFPTSKVEELFPFWEAVVPSVADLPDGQCDAVRITTAGDKLAMLPAEYPPLLDNATWAAGTGWAWDSATEVGTGTATSANLVATLKRPLVVTQSYLLTFTMTVSGGAVQPYLGTQAGTSRSTAATFAEIIACATSGTLTFDATGFTGTISAISLFPITPPLVLGWEKMPASVIAAIIRTGAVVTGEVCFAGWLGRPNRRA